MGEILFWMWVVFVIGGTIAVRWHSPAGLVEGLVFNSLIFLLPAYWMRNHYRKKAISS